MKKLNFKNLALPCLALGLMASAPAFAVEADQNIIITEEAEEILLAGAACGNGCANHPPKGGTPQDRPYQPPKGDDSMDDTNDPQNTLPQSPKPVPQPQYRGGGCSQVAQNSGKAIQLSRRVNLI